ncbi:MFS general substrate transporter [Dissoconium aciculare CBS 342.82]|uniref:Autophagy-related protein n=1 Tax=Dissoconium aciculare CBS 342.82 TaxID=1314786 RepID=A0A6J3MDV0_9PEZI|nr:MFS general substrate transporter [Dissoconium aciculare CBS 342.82]KAF1825027.1 MFS general substrate transporter [Dissoconium aciculare CBS 342.82]
MGLRLSGDQEGQLPGTRPIAYPGEDTRPTSRKELLGFYTYSFAAEVFVVCGLGAFIPITLESLARASPSAVLANDRTKPCLGGSNTADGAARLMFPRSSDSGAPAQCVFDLFGSEINTASFAMYTFSISVAIQALIVVTMSGAADHGRYRKALLLTFALVGSLATISFIAITPDVFVLGSLLAMIGNVGFGASFVLLNSFLPVLVRNHPAAAVDAQASVYESVPTSEEDVYPSPIEDEQRRSAESPLAERSELESALLPPVEQLTPYPSSPAAPSSALGLSTKISSYGVSVGYAAAVIVQILSLIILSTTGSTIFSLRLVLFTIGLWWLTFTIPVVFWLRPRPGPPLSRQGGTWLGYLTHSWLKLGRTMLRARRLQDVLLFLAAWFMISDAIATVSGVAILFAKTTLGMSPAQLALINIITTVAGIIGALTWSQLSRALALKPSQTIIACIALFELIPIYGLLGYIPAIQRLGVIGLQKAWEMYPLAAVYGLVLGGLSSYCRSLFGELIPPGSEAAFFALFAITDKGSSIFGPAIVGAITDATGDIRPAFWFLAVLIGLPIPLMCFVNVERGKREGAALARESIVQGDEGAGGEALEATR